jgi:transcriptional regulator with XRE-family HTH domain
MATLSERLKELRIEGNALQQDIASAVDLSLRGYQRYERGERIPDGDVIINLCRFFNVSADYLLGLSDERERR